MLKKKSKQEPLTKSEVKGFRRKISDAVDTQYDTNIMRVRQRHMDRWTQMCGGVFDITHPVVHLEWEMCDLKNQRLLMKGKRSEFFERANLTPEEIDLYLNGKDYAGTPYTYIETRKIRKETGRALKMVIKRKI